MNIQAFDFSVDLLRALLWQYTNAPALQSVLASKQAWYDGAQEGFWSDWVTDVFDLRTANDFGLAVWARILAIPLVVLPAAQAAKPILFFSSNHANFTHGNFAASAASHALSVDQRRLVLRLRYFQLTTRAAVPEVNAFLAVVFGAGVVYATLPDPMHIHYHFTAAIPSALELVLTQFDVLPRPAGVRVTHGT